jgi:hypothetical protein
LPNPAVETVAITNVTADLIVCHGFCHIIPTTTRPSSRPARPSSRRLCSTFAVYTSIKCYKIQKKFTCVNNATFTNLATPHEQAN